MAVRVGFGRLRSVDSVEVIENARRMFRAIRRFEGFLVQNRVQGAEKGKERI